MQNFWKDFKLSLQKQDKKTQTPSNKKTSHIKPYQEGTNKNIQFLKFLILPCIIIVTIALISRNKHHLSYSNAVIVADIPIEIATASIIKPQSAPQASQSIFQSKPAQMLSAKLINIQKPSEHILYKEINKIPFTIQVSSYKDKISAEQALAKLKKNKYNAFLSVSNLRNKEKFYRLYVGEFKNKAAAISFHNKFKKIYKNSFVTSSR